MTTETIGHDANCSLAAALRDAGGTPLMKGDFTSEVEFEHFISESGLFGTRPKTKDGCPRYRAYAEETQKAVASALLAAINEHPNVLGEGPPQRQSRGGNQQAQLVGGPSRPAG